MNTTSLETNIIAKALELGFNHAGIAKSGSSKSFNKFSDWVNSGQAAGMDYLHKHADLRANPSNITDGTKTIIACSAQYPVNKDPGNGFSTFARGEDYHEVLRAKLKSLTDYLITNGASIARVCVDSAPLLEREWAVRAGLGWIGKQGQVVNPETGCCMFLSFILTDLELSASEEISNQCGDCNLCLEACPTSALTQNSTVDARKCISYLTIEEKGHIPREIAKSMKETLFGCDFCTSVCPFNNNASHAIMEELRPKPMPNADELLEMSIDDFKKRFMKTAIYRTGLEKIQNTVKAIFASEA